MAGLQDDRIGGSVGGGGFAEPRAAARAVGEIDVETLAGVEVFKIDEALPADIAGGGACMDDRAGVGAIEIEIAVE
ncbi:MAG TPA: hypothetical protein PK217_09440, partial [Sphingopyxis terrae]|nr:hypothetical protein [Sphingopyxis terrae]